MGYLHIGLIAYKSEMHHMGERIRGYLASLKAPGVGFHANWLKEVPFKNAKELVKTAIDEMLASAVPVEFNHIFNLQFSGKWVEAY